METLYRYVSGAAAGIAGLFAPAGPLIATTLLFIVMDFLSGVAADRAAAAAPAVRGTSRAARRGARSQRPPSS